MFQTFVAATLAACATGHGTMMSPRQWSAGNEMYENYTFLPASVKPTISTYNPLKTMKECPKWTIPSARDSAGNSLGCYGSPGLAPGKGVDSTFNHPWRAPGRAFITSPCGINGGNPKGCPAGNPFATGCNSGGHGHGADGRLGFGAGIAATWKAGSVQPITWYVHANHNGGYSYRLAKKPRTAMEINEADFQKGSLQFTGNHLIVYHSALTPNKEIKARDTTFAETPGQYWRQNPIPCCTWLEAGPSTSCTFPAGPQFTPQVGSKGEKLMGYGPFKDWYIQDKVIIPDHLEAGEYILSWRWDTEEFAQVWTSCANVRITNNGPVPPAPTPKPPAPTPRPTPKPPAPTPSPVPPAPTPVPPAPTPVPPAPTPVPPAPTPGCQDKDLSCSSLAEAYCGKSFGGCLGNSCPDDTYTWEFKDFSGGQCHYHCTCKSAVVV